MAASTPNYRPFDNNGVPNYTHGIHLTKEGRYEEMGPAQPQEPQVSVNDDKQMEEYQKRYEAMVWDLVENKGYSPRKARRYLESEARRQGRQIVRAGKRRRKEMEKNGELVDTSDLRAQLDTELAEDLAKQIAAESQDVTIDIETTNYKPPTDEF